MRGAALAALDRPAMALGPKERAEVELGAAFFARLAELVRSHQCAAACTSALEQRREGLDTSCSMLGRSSAVPEVRWL